MRVAVALAMAVLPAVHGAINCTAAGPPLSPAREAEFLRGAAGFAEHHDLPEWFPYTGLLWILSFAMGLGKGGAPGVSTSAVAFNALYAPDGCLDLATSLQVPVTTMADIAVVVNFFQNARWDIILRLLPGTGLGVAIGSQLVGTLSSSQAKLLVGTVLSLILVIGIWQELPKTPHKKKSAGGSEGKGEDATQADDKDGENDSPAAWATSQWFSGVVGIVGGFATILTNSMGPMLNVFLLTQKLEPTSFVGTRATFFSVVNFLKLAQRMYAGTLTWDMIIVGCKMGIASVVGVLLAKMALKRMSKSLFTLMQYVALSYSSAKLLSSGLLA